MELAIICTLFSFIGIYILYFSVLREENKISFYNYLVSKNIKINLVRNITAIISSVAFTYIALKIFDTSLHEEWKIVISLILYPLIMFCSYISLYDFEYFEVPFFYTLVAVGIILLITIVLIFTVGFNNQVDLWTGFSIKPSEILLGGIISTLFISAIVLFSHEKAMGIGDIPIAAIMGLVLTSRYLLAGFYITILSALVIGLIYSVSVKRFKGLRIPFVPFICIGIIGGIIFGEVILKYLYIY